MVSIRRDCPSGDWLLVSEKRSGRRFSESRMWSLLPASTRTAEGYLEKPSTHPLIQQYEIERPSWRNLFSYFSTASGGWEASACT